MGIRSRIQSKVAFTCLVLGLIASGARASEPVPAPERLIVGVHDSFLGGGKGQKELAERFPGIEVRSLGDAGQLPARLALERRVGKPLPDVVVGLDSFNAPRAAEFVEPWGEWAPRDWKRLDARAKLPKGLLPYDYGLMAFIADQAELARRELPEPRSYRDLLKPEYRRQFLLEDPRSSTVGQGFHQAWKQVLGGDSVAALAGQRLALLPGWDEAYGLFLKKEAPLVWSYTTSEAYHLKEGRTGYRAVLFEEGQPAQVEGAAIVRGTPRIARARQFLEFLLTRETQAWVARKQWMFPARADAEVPESYGKLRPVRGVIEARPTGTAR